MKRSRKLAVAFLALVTAAVIFSGASKEDFRLGRNMEILFNVFREISLIYVDPIDPDTLLMDAAAGMTARLDPYTQFMPEEEMAAFEVMTTGKYGGIGSLIRQRGEWIVIAQPYEGFPADKAGLRIGDKLIEIAGEDARGMAVSRASNLLKGDPGTTVKLKVEKLLTGDTVSLALRRERITISGISYYGFAEPGIGYIKHDDFTEDCSSDMRKALEELRRGGLTGLILDLRGNGGGILQEAVKIVSLFTPKGTEVVSMRGRIREMDAVFHTENNPADLDIPIVVLVDGSSASAAEIVAGAMQDLDRAVLLGQRTFGKGLVQSTRPVGFNSYMKITTARYYIPSGRCIQAIDYTHRREDGSVGYVPDSLRREFFTAAGRSVLDGGGITPDITTPAERAVSGFVIEAYVRGYIEDFVDDYMRNNPGLQVSPETFSLSEDTYAAFTAFMRGKPMQFESRTQAAINSLREAALGERYFDMISVQLEQMERNLPDKTEENIVLYRDEFSRLIEDEKILRFHYRRGVVRHAMARDGDVAAAASLLKDTEKYRGILSAPQ